VVAAETTRMAMVFTDAKEATNPIVFARSHDLLTRERWASASLHDIVKDALEPFGVSDALAERLVIRGDNIRLSPKVTLALRIAINELATNAMKHGAYSNDAGSIEISWTSAPSVNDNRLILSWKEKGGPTVFPPIHKGFGLHVIEGGLAQELERSVSLAFNPTGLVFTLDFPASRGPRDA
jgi:two-component sensor histidine kinase